MSVRAVRRYAWAVTRAAERIRYEPGSFCWVGLATSDPAGAGAFYASLSVGRASAGLGGAAVFRAPFEVLDEGRIAAIRDPLGAILSLWQPQGRPGAGVVNELNTLGWIELVTSDLELSQSFYRGLFGWDYEPADGGCARIRAGGPLGGGMRLSADGERDAPPAWLPHFAVESADRAARNAEQSGGRRLAATMESGIGRLAILADPQGARFAVLEAREGIRVAG